MQYNKLTQIEGVAVDQDNKLLYQFQVWDNYITLPAMGTQTNDKSRALTAKTTNFLMIDLQVTINLFVCVVG